MRRCTVAVLPRIQIVPTSMPLEFKRLQFSVLLAFVMSNELMTIKKKKNTRYKNNSYKCVVCGLNLEMHAFHMVQLTAGRIFMGLRGAWVQLVL